MHRSIRIALVVVTAALAAAPSAAAAPALRGSTVADDMATLRGWSVSGRPARRRLRFEPANVYALDAHALRLGTGGSIRRALPERPWSLSLDVRLPRHGIVRIDLGGEPVVLMQRADGRLQVTTAESQGATLPRGSAGAGGWHHVEVAAHDPAELHVDGTRIPSSVRPGSRIQLRTLRGTADLTGLVATRRDDRRALLLHRLAGIRWATPGRRLPVAVGPGGALRFERGRDDGFYAGALWNAYALTGGRLFARWGERATFDQFELNDHRRPPAHWQGLRWLVSSANADQRTCTPVPRQHRCRLLRKSTSSTPLYGMSNGNPGNWAIPSLLWPRRCPSCQSSDEVEIRIDTMMDVGILEWNHQLSEWSRAAYPNNQAGPSPNGPRAIEHVEVVRRLLLRDDGSAVQGVRTNRLDGTVLSYEGANGIGPGGTWARGHAGAVYGFARTGLRYERGDLVAAGDRAAGYLAASLPASRIPPHDLAAPDGPPDPDTGPLYAAGLLRLAEACERLATACGAGAPARWRALATEMLGAYLARLSTHLPAGGTPEGQALSGIHFALEAIEREAAAR